MATADGRPDTRGQVLILPVEVHRQLRIAAAEEDMSMHRMLQKIVTEYLERREAEIEAVK